MKTINKIIALFSNMNVSFGTFNLVIADLPGGATLTVVR